MTGPVFVDTNVLIYALDDADRAKQLAARRWREELWRRRAGRISFQVLQEFYAKVRQKWPPAAEFARAEILDLLTWRPVSVNGGLLQVAWKVQDRYRLSFWDALIVAAARVTESRYLLTEDLQVGQELEGVIVVSPFLTDPDSILAPR